MKMKLCLDQQSLIAKPKNKKIMADISNRIAGEEYLMESKDIAEKVGNQGRSFCPAVFRNGRRLSDDFREMQLFALDFDQGISYQEVRRKAEEYGLPILFAYHTLSSTEEHPRFRIVFAHCIRIDNKKACEILIAMLIKLFDECDQSCCDVNRMFLGGKGLLDFQEGAVIRIDRVAEALCFKFYREDKRNSARAVKSFGKKYGIEVKGGSLLISGGYQGGESEDLSPKTLYIYKDLGENSSFFRIETVSPRLHPPDRPEKITHKPYRNIQLMKAGERCKLLKEFMEGRHLKHDWKFLLITNLLKIENGTTFFLKYLSLAPDTTEVSYDKWKHTIKYIRDNRYFPMSCRKCPYCDECNNHKENLLLTLGETVQLLSTEQFYPESYVIQKLEEELQEAVNDKSDKIHLIKAQTAIGKTRLYCKVVRQSQIPFIIAVPTLRLKKEVIKTLNEGIGCKIPVKAIPCLDEVDIPKNIKEEIQRSYDRGLNGTARILRMFINKNKDKPNEIIQRQMKEAQKYLEDIHLDRINGKKHLVMTHSRLFTIDPATIRDYQVIIDEDILLSCMKNTGEIPRKAVEKAFRKGIGGRTLEWFLNLEKNKCEKNLYSNNIFCTEEELNLGNIYENLNGLLNSAVCYAGEENFYFFTPKHLPKGKYIVMSATLSCELYRRYFEKDGMEVKEYHSYKVKYKGKLVQYTKYSCSRKCLEEKPRLFEKIRRITGGVETLTFNKYIGGVPNETGLSITNCAGSNQLKGKDICVIGTPFTRPEVYLMIGKYLEEGSNGKMKKSLVEYGGFRFPLMTYEPGILREIQLYMISSDLEQSVGRARILRENATVYLFSSFPCEQAEIHGEDYYKEET